MYTGFSLLACDEVWFLVGQIYSICSCHLSYYQKEIMFFFFLHVAPRNFCSLSTHSTTRKNFLTPPVMGAVLSLEYRTARKKIKSQRKIHHWIVGHKLSNKWSMTMKKRTLSGMATTHFMFLSLKLASDASPFLCQPSSTLLWACVHLSWNISTWWDPTTTLQVKGSKK